MKNRELMLYRRKYRSKYNLTEDIHDHDWLVNANAIPGFAVPESVIYGGFKYYQKTKSFESDPTDPHGPRILKIQEFIH